MRHSNLGEMYKSGIKRFLDSLQYDDRPIRLACLTDEHVAQLKAIGYQPEIWRYARYPKNDSEQFDKYFNKVLKRDDSVNFAIIDSDSSEVIGFTRLKSICDRRRTAEIGTWMVPKAHVKGMNYFVKRELLAVAFKFLELDMVYCLVHPDNTPCIKSLFKLGFSRNKRFDEYKRDHENSETHLLYFSYFCSWYDHDFGNRLPIAS